MCKCWGNVQMLGKCANAGEMCKCMVNVQMCKCENVQMLGKCVEM